VNASTETHEATPSIWMLMVVYVCCAVFFWFRDSFMNGPFTFLDEAVYFQLARTIWEQFNYAGHTAYNPLYSFLIAPLFALGPETAVYGGVRVLNALLWASGLFPIFWLARRWLDGIWLPLGVAAAAVLMPLSANVPLVRAEPLFFPLFALSVWLGLRMLEENQPRSGALAGLAAGLLFLTKQGGLTVVISLGVMWLFSWWREGRPVRRVHTALAFAAGFLPLALPWMIRNRMIGDSPLGYGSWVDKMVSGAGSLKLLHTFGLNLTYVFVALWGGFFLLYIFSLVQLPALSREEQILGGFSLALLLSEVLFGALIGSVLPEHQNHPSFLPTGRYIDNSFPLIWVFLLRVAGRQPGVLVRRWAQTLVLWTVGCAGVYFYSPIQAVVAKSAAENPSLAFLVPLFASSGGNWWDLPRIVTPWQRWALVLGMAALIVPFLLLGQRARLAVFLCAGNFVSGLFAARNVHNVALAARGQNETSIWLVEHQVPVSQIGFDEALQPNISPYVFWFRGTLFQSGLHVMSPVAALLPVHFDFGPIDAPLPSGSVRIPAPWRGEALFDPKKGFGFRTSDLSNLRSDAPSGFTSQDKLRNYIFGDRDSRFEVMVPPTKPFAVTIDADVPATQTTLPVDFELALGDRSWRIKRNGAITRAHIATGPLTLPGGELNINFLPAPHSVWVVNQVEVKLVDGERPHSERYFVSTARLPLAIAHSFLSINIYDLSSELSQSSRSTVPQTPDSAELAKDAQNKPLSHYAQELHSPVKSLSLQPGEIVRVPVTIRNAGRESWGIGGTYPILLSYRWWSGGKMSPLEGRRTARTRILLPGESDQIAAEVEAPSDRGEYTLRLSLVQERVAWFFAYGGAVDVPVTVH
jgi:hypothetical protein